MAKIAGLMLVGVTMLCNTGCLLTCGTWRWAQSRGASRAVAVVLGEQQHFVVFRYSDCYHGFGSGDRFHALPVPTNWQTLPVRYADGAADVAGEEHVPLELVRPMAFAPCDKAILHSGKRMDVLRLSKRRLSSPPSPRFLRNGTVYGVLRELREGTGDDARGENRVDSIYGFDTGLNRWVRLATVPAFSDRGHVLRKVGAVIATPLTASLDVALSPFYIVAITQMDGIFDFQIPY